MARYRIDPERSRIAAEAQSNLRPIRIETTGLEGWFEAELDGHRIDPGVAPTGRIQIRAERLRTGNGLYDRELERRLDSRTYPYVRGDITAVRELDATGRYAVRGDLRFHGVTCAVEGEVHLRAIDEQTVEIEGEQLIDVRDFGLETPRLLMLTIRPELRVRGHIVAMRDR